MAYLLSLFTLLQSYNIIWENSVIEIPLYASVEDYLYLPEAKVYSNNEEIFGAEHYYEYGVNHTFISVVNSNHVKSFFVDYKVYFPKQNKTSIQTIEFKIVDLIPPTMVYVPELKSSLGQKIIDVEKDIIYEDNYYDIKDIQVFVDTSKVNINKVGFYEVLYTLVDKSLNQTKYITNYEVYDETPPVIKLKKDLYHEINVLFRWQNYFSITDNDPNNLTVIVNDDFVCYTKLGKYVLTIEAIDNSFNRTIYEDVIEIIDTTPPELKLTSNPDYIEVLTPISELDLLKYVTFYQDNETNNGDLNWVITHDIDPNRIGTYQINYQLFDNSNNKVEKSLKVQVKDTKAPVITLLKPLSFDVYSAGVDILEYFIIEDNFDHFFELNVKTDGSINYKKVGTYPITITATDLSKNQAVYKANVYIIDNVSPTITHLKEVVVHPGDYIDFYDYFLFEDNYDDELIVYFDIPINLDEIGSYIGVVEVMDNSFNLSIFEFEIIVIDLRAPIITLKREEVTITEGDEIDFKTFILNVSDDVSNLTIDDVVIDDSLFENKRGVYKINYWLFDESLNKGIETLYVYVLEKDDITFDVKSLFKKPNEIINYQEGLTIDGSDYEYYQFGENLYEKEGKYVIVHIIISKYGKIYRVEQQVTVTKIFNASKHIIPLLAISFGVLSTSLLLVKRKKEGTNTFDK